MPQIQYISASEAAIKWGISHRRVITLCRENRIPNVAMLGNMWIIPSDAEKPADRRTTRYDKKNPAKPFINGQAARDSSSRQSANSIRRIWEWK